MSAIESKNEPDDPIEEGFPLMVDAAKRLCKGAEDVGCFQYHRAWAYLRRIGLRSVIPRAPHYVDALRTLAREGRRRILVSGTADYNMLAKVLHAYRGEGVEPRVHIVDLCE